MKPCQISLCELLGAVVMACAVMPIWPSMWHWTSHLYFAAWLIVIWIYVLAVWRKWKINDYQNILSEDDVINLGVPPIMAFVGILCVIRFEFFSPLTGLLLWFGVIIFPVLCVVAILRLAITFAIRHGSSVTNTLVAANYLLCICSIFFWQS
jgi:hypothetical protein